MDSQDIKKILVIKLRHIGDVLLAAPVFRVLKNNFPGAHISALVNRGTEEVLSGNPFIDEVMVFDRGIKKMGPVPKYLKELSFLRKIRREGFDMAIDLTGGDRPAILSFVSGARCRFGWRSKKGLPGKNRLYTHLSEPDGNTHMVLQNLSTLTGMKVMTHDLVVDFHIPRVSEESVRKILGDCGIDAAADTIVHVHPTSRWLFKCWKDEYMAEIIEWLLGTGAAVAVTSSPDAHETDKARKILSLVGRSPRLIDLCAKTTIKQLAALSRLSTLFFGVDSAPMHIAAAVGTPVVALFGPSGAFNWGPWNNENIVGARRRLAPTGYPRRNGVQVFGMHTVIQRDWNCAPCGKDGCGGSKRSKCLEEITVGEVRDALLRKLRHAGF
ncbi:MAG TPA: putative lipopolysaccharide heptosyltransferase III [Dissulfurispiraceae bacterium]